MASTKLEHTKDGRPYYQIVVHMSQGLTYKTRWYYDPVWSQKTIDRELARYAFDYEERCKNGEVLNRKQKAAKEETEAAEAAKIKTMKQYVDAIFMPSIELRCTGNTIASYWNNLNKWILPALGANKLADITPAMITAMLTDMQRQGKSHASLIKVYNITNSIFKMAELDDSVPVNPMHRVIRPKEAKEEKTDGIQALTVDQVKEVLIDLKNESLMWQVYVLLLLQTGMRRGEACGLQWKNVDFKHNMVTVEGSLNYTPNRGIYYGKTKSGKSRTVRIGENLAALMKEYKADKKILSQWVFTQSNTADPLFPTSPTKFCRTFGEKYGIQNFHPHLLRHSFASIAATNGADIKSLSEVLGHSDTSVTLRMYVHGNEESRNKVSDIVQKIINE